MMSKTRLKERFGRTTAIALPLVAILLAAILALPLACGKKEAGEIKIGAILSLTGSAAQYGEWSKNGIELAKDEINSSGGINGLKILVVYEDDQSDPKSAVSAARKLVTNDRVSAIIGPLTSSNVLAVAPVANETKTVLISPCASSPKITEAGEYVFRNWPSDDFEGNVMADFIAHDLKLQTVAVLAINNEYGVGIRDVFIRRAREDGLQIVYRETFDQNATDFRTHLTKIAPLKPDVIYMPVYVVRQFGHGDTSPGPEEGQVTRALNQLGKLYVSQARYEEAESYLRRGQEILNVYVVRQFGHGDTSS